MPHLTLYDQLGDMPILGAIVGRGLACSQLGAEVPTLRQKFPLWLGAHAVPYAQNGSSLKKMACPPLKQGWYNIVTAIGNSRVSKDDPGQPPGSRGSRVLARSRDLLLILGTVILGAQRDRHLWPTLCSVMAWLLTFTASRIESRLKCETLLY